MTIYVVTSGSYSDYSIDGVFTSKEKAQIVFGVGCNIEEYEADAGVDKRLHGLDRWRVFMQHDGEARVYTAPQYNEPDICYRANELEYCFEMWAKDEQHAIKIANERRVQLIAENKW